MFVLCSGGCGRNVEDSAVVCGASKCLEQLLSRMLKNVRRYKTTTYRPFMVHKNALLDSYNTLLKNRQGEDARQ